MSPPYLYPEMIDELRKFVYLPASADGLQR